MIDNFTEYGKFDNDGGKSHKEVEMLAKIKEYDTRLDSKNRFTVRGAEYDYYHVREFDDGHIELHPRVLVDPIEISKNTLSMIDSAAANMQTGRVSAPIDLSTFKDE